MPEARVSAITALGRMQVEAAIPTLLSLVNDEHEWVKQAVVKVMREDFTAAQDAVARQSLIAALDDPNPSVRVVGLMGLTKLPPYAVSHELLPRLQNLIEQETDNPVIQSAIHTLGKLGGARVTTYLCELLSKYRDTDTELTLINMLGRIGGPSVVPTLLERLQATASSAIPSRNALWSALTQTQFLCGLFAQRPVAETVLYASCLRHDVRVMADATVVLADGRRLPCEEAVRWL
jgi:HEAT repeat protein